MPASLSRLSVRLTRRVLEVAFKPQTLVRAEDYLARGYVLAVAVSGDGASITSKVQGADSEIYQQDIHLHNQQGRTLVRDFCTCPVNGHCKHVAAVLLSLLTDTPVDKLRIEQWFTQLNQVGNDPLPPSGYPIPEALLYVLSRDELGVAVELRRAKVGKKGLYGKGAKVPMTDIDHAHQWAFTADDGMIVRMLLSMQTDRRYGKLYLKGDIGHLTLAKIMNSNRCFWEESRAPITQGKARQLSVYWDKADAQHHRLQMSLEAVESWELISTEPPMYVEQDFLTLGPIACDVAANKLILLSQMPPIVNDDCAHVVLKLAEHFPASLLPQTIGVEILPIITAPKVKMRFAMASMHSYQGLGVAKPASTYSQPVVQLSFDYQGIEFAVTELNSPAAPLTLNPISLIAPNKALLAQYAKRREFNLGVALDGASKTDHIRLQVQRDWAAESAAIASLQALGLAMITTISGRQIGEPCEVTNLDTAGSTNQLEPDSHTGQDYAQWSFKPLPDNILQWQTLTHDNAKICRDLGFDVEFSADFSLNIVDANLVVELDDSESGWFSLSLSADIEGGRVPLLPIIAAWISRFGEPGEDATMLLPDAQSGRWINIKTDSIRPLIGVITELFSRRDSSIDDTAKLRLPLSRLALLNELSMQQLSLLKAERLSHIAQKLQHFNGIERLAAPKGLQAQLRDYQMRGVEWLCFLKEYGFGGILADDMGLGKTLQSLAFLQHQQNNGRHSRGTLIICPTSLVGNWAKEAAKFTPTLKLVVIHGQRRQSLLAHLADYDIVVTTYPLLVRDLAHYRSYQFDHLILDEAQQIKNAQAKVTQNINLLKADFKLCLSGTPLENHLGELKSLFDFCLPGLLGQQSHFNNTFRQPIEKDGDSAKATALAERIAPFLLRRTKDNVMAELPVKTVIDQYLVLEKDQRNLYETIRVSMEKKIQELFAQKGVASSHIHVLDALLKLRQVCCDARLVDLSQAQAVHSNAKLNWLVETVPEMVEEGRKILIFSQFTSMLELIAISLEGLGIAYSKLTGQTRNRQTQIDQFQEGNHSVFLISLKAGGTGLNLTAADTVIHYDPWWNPASEKQATDRAHRMGQQKPVFVYRLIAQGTVEEKIQQMQQHKQALSDSVFSGESDANWQGDATELLALFQ